MYFHRLRLLAFGNSSSPSDTPPSRTAISKHDNANKNCPSIKETNTPHELSIDKSTTKCPPVSNKSENERMPLRHKTKSDTTLSFSFTKIMGNLGHRNTASLSDIKKRFSRCCSKRFRQTLHMFRTGSDPKDHVTNKTVDGTSKEIEVLSAPNLKLNKTKSLKERNTFELSSLKLDKFQRDVRLFDLYSVSKNSNKKNTASNKSQHFRKRRIRNDKSAPTLQKANHSKSFFKSESIIQGRYNVLNFPSTSKCIERVSKHRIKKLKLSASNKSKEHHNDKKPASVNVRNEVPTDSKDCAKRLPSTEPSKQSSMQALQCYDALPVHNINNTMSKSPSKINNIVSNDAKMHYTVSFQYFPKNERTSRRILRCLVFWTIITVWSPCICLVWFSWCILYPLKQRDHLKTDCKSKENSKKILGIPKSTLFDFCCGWSQITDRILPCFTSKKKVMRSERRSSTPHEVPSRAFSGSFIRRSSNKKRCYIVYSSKDNKNWMARPINKVKPSCIPQKILAKGDSYESNPKVKKLKKRKARCVKGCSHTKLPDTLLNGCDKKVKTVEKHKSNNSPKPDIACVPVYHLNTSQNVQALHHLNALDCHRSTTGETRAKYTAARCDTIYTQKPYTCAECLASVTISSSHNKKVRPTEVSCTKSVIDCSKCTAASVTRAKVLKLPPITPCAPNINETTIKCKPCSDKKNHQDGLSLKVPKKKTKRFWGACQRERQGPGDKDMPIKFCCTQDDCEYYQRNVWSRMKCLFGFNSPLTCDDPFLLTLTNRPYHGEFANCPWLYPYFLDCRRTCLNVGFGCVMCLAGLLYSPMIVLLYVVHFLCCRLCCLTGLIN